MREEPFTVNSSSAFNKASPATDAAGNQANPVYFPPQHYTRLLTGLVHKLNNVITVLSGHTGLLLLQPKLSRSVRDPVEQMMEATQLLSRYLDEAVLLSRSPRLEFGPVDIVPILAALSEAADVHLKLDGLPPAAVVHGEAHQLRSAFEQTLRNAQEAQAQNVTCRIQELPDYCQVNFRDDGRGINGDVISRIFEPFFTTKRKDHIGIGLFKVQGYLALTGGRLEVVSDGKTYTEARFFLPKTTAHG